jgi:small subunit ribosomal protein S14
MSTNAKEARFRVQTVKLDKHRAEMAKPEGQRDPANLMAPRDRIKIRLRCKICGRGRAVYRKFGVCRICLRKLASDGLVPGMTKASW